MTQIQSDEGHRNVQAWNKYATDEVLREVRNERHYQEARFGRQDMPYGFGSERDQLAAKTYRAVADIRAENDTLTHRNVLVEEVFEAFAETDPEKMRAELIQVAAVAVKIVEQIDRELIERERLLSEYGTGR